MNSKKGGGKEESKRLERIEKRKHGEKKKS